MLCEGEDRPFRRVSARSRHPRLHAGGKTLRCGVFENPIDLTKISDNLADAVRKRSALAEDNPDFANLPP